MMMGYFNKSIRCNIKPPKGFDRCTRINGHSGPCAMHKKPAVDVCGIVIVSFKIIVALIIAAIMIYGFGGHR